jgi:hypothetical protein
MYLQHMIQSKNTRIGPKYTELNSDYNKFIDTPALTGALVDWVTLICRKIRMSWNPHGIRKAHRRPTSQRRVEGRRDVLGRLLWEREL